MQFVGQGGGMLCSFVQYGFLWRFRGEYLVHKYLIGYQYSVHRIQTTSMNDARQLMLDFLATALSPLTEVCDSNYRSA